MLGLGNKKLFLFDIDGTIALGSKFFDGSYQLLSYIEKELGKAYFISNNSTKSEQDYAKSFWANFRYRVTPNRFVTSGYVTVEYLKQHFRNGRIFLIGTKSFQQALTNQGFTVTDAPDYSVDCVLVAFDQELTYRKLENACSILANTNVPFLATNPDLRCPMTTSYIPDCGAICQMLTSTVGKVPIYLGKPSRTICDICMERTHYSPEETLVVGDRLYTDIACGINAGVETCVLYSGEATPEEVARSEYKPTYAFDNVRQLYEALQTASSQA